MQTFKKLISAILLFVLSVSILSAIIIEPFFSSKFEYYNDAGLRDDLAGNLDYLFVGASNGMCAFVPYVADEKMNVCSYNLSGGLMTWYGRKAMLEKELVRNPVKKVVLEISYDAMARNYHDGWGDNITLCRLGSVSERMKYLFKYVSFSDVDEIYGAILGDGVSYMISTAKNFVVTKFLHGEATDLDRVPVKSKGFHDKSLEGTSSLVVDSETAKKIYNSQESMVDFNDKNIAELKSIVEMCKAKNVEVTLVVVPHSDFIVFEYDNWDKLSGKWKSLAKDLDCDLIDFNLLKSRYSFLKDEECFFDKVHMTRTGAEKFTEVYCDVMTQFDAGKDISKDFYNNYAEMKADSPYMKYLGDNKKQS